MVTAVFLHKLQADDIVVPFLGSLWLSLLDMEHLYIGLHTRRLCNGYVGMLRSSLARQFDGDYSLSFYWGFPSWHSIPDEVTDPLHGTLYDGTGLDFLVG